MRNMMSQERNCNQSVSPKDGLSVKRSVRLLATVGLTALAVFFAGCKDKDKEELVNPYVTPGVTDNPDWKVTGNNNLSVSMTAVVNVSFTDKQGILAAFIGNNCCGIAEYKPENGLYWLYISPVTEEGGNVQLRFYSPDLKRIFDASSTFPFRNDAHYGTVADPYTPIW